MKVNKAYYFHRKWCMGLFGTMCVLIVFTTYKLEFPRVSSLAVDIKAVLPGSRFFKQVNRQMRGNKKRVEHLRFLKVHKAASTTMQNLVFRFAIRHNLTVALPEQGHNIFNLLSIIKPRNAAGLYDIFATHTYYSKVWFDSLPIPDDAFNIAIVREPKTRLISAAYKYRHGGIRYLQKIPQSNYISNLLHHTEKYDYRWFSVTKNSMGRDFGFSVNKSKIDTHLRLLEKEFALVLIVERFDESLVMLKRLLNWQLQDILYQVAHSFKHEQVNLTQDDMRQLKKLNYLDYAVYEHFAEMFDRKVKHETDDFMDEVQHLKDTVQAVSAFCRAGNNTLRKFETTRWNEEFVLRRSECELMNMQEIAFIEYLKKRQLKEMHVE